MPFKAGDPKTIEAARRGGVTGRKHLETLSKAELHEITAKAGRASGERRRHLREQRAAHNESQKKRRAEKAAIRYQGEIMEGYME